MIDQDPSFRAVIVTGAGEKAFAAGADIAEMQHKDVLEARAFASLGNKIFSKLENVNKPVIAKEILFTGDLINAERAYEIGLVNRVVDSTEVLEEVKKMAKTIAAKSPLGGQFSKKSVNEGVNLDLDQALSLETELFGSLFSTKDQAEGMSAFLEKRQPFFIGK